MPRTSSTISRAFFLLIMSLFVCSSPGYGSAPGPGEILVNLTTPDDQSEPSIAVDSAGNFVVAWHTTQSLATAGYDIYARLFDKGGISLSSEFSGPEVPGGDQLYPDVAANPAGDFVITWFEESGAGWTVKARLFDSSGIPLTSDLVVDQGTMIGNGYQAVAMDDSGNFVVAWTGWDAAYQESKVIARMFDSAGAPASAEFIANTYDTGLQSMPAIAMDSDGDFLILWHSFGQDGFGYGVYGQRFDPAGTPVGSEFRINGFVNNDQQYPAVAMGQSDYIAAVWESNGQDGDGLGVFGNVFDNLDAPVLAFEMNLPTHWEQHQGFNNICTLPGGVFAAVWNTSFQDGNEEGVYGVRFDQGGAYVGAQFPVNVYTPGAQKFADVACRDDGGIVVAWQSEQSDVVNDHDIIIRIFKPCATTPECDDGLFCTGVETCDNGVCVSTGDPCGDGLFCNGFEVCDEAGDSCSPGPNPCLVGQWCDEIDDLCYGDDDDDDDIVDDDDVTDDDDIADDDDDLMDDDDTVGDDDDDDTSDDDDDVTDDDSAGDDDTVGDDDFADDDDSAGDDDDGAGDDDDGIAGAFDDDDDDDTACCG